MKVYVMCYGGYPIAVYSRKKKMLESYVKRCKKYREEIIKDLENALQNIFRDEYSQDPMSKIEKSAMREILNLFLNKEYDSSPFSLSELSECIDPDYSFDSFEIDK